MELTIRMLREMVDILRQNVTLRFPPMAVDNYIQLAIEMADVPVSSYKFDKEKGSLVTFTPRQYVDFVTLLADALKDEELVTDEEKDEIRRVLDHVTKQLSQA